MDLRGPFHGREGKGKDGEREGKVVEGYRRVVVSEMTYTVLSGTLNSSIPYHTIPFCDDLESPITYFPKSFCQILVLRVARFVSDS